MPTKSYRLLAVMTALLTTSSDLLAQTFDLEPGMRWRFQDVTDPVSGDAQANTLLLRLTAAVKPTHALSGQLQVDYVEAFNQLDYSDGVVLRNASLIPDPEGSDINQLWLSYQPEFGGALTAGRQVLSSDNERHLGGNGFWQNEQSFDAIRYSLTLLNELDVDYAYVKQVNRIFGSDADNLLSREDIRFTEAPERPAIEQGVHDHQSHLLDVRYPISDTISISGFWYALNNRTFHGFSSQTLGIRVQGSMKPAAVRYDYRIEAATQTDAFDSPWRYSANYFAASLGAQLKSHKFELSYENIGSDNGFGFVHSLGSNHQFQGWADIFSQYRKPEGIADTFLTYRGRSGKLRWRSKLHVYNSSDHDTHVGNELNLEIAWRATRKWEVSAVWARYYAKRGFASLPESQQDRTTWFVSLKYNL